MMELHEEIPLTGSDPYEESDDYRSGMAIALQEDANRMLAGIASNIERMANYTARQLSKEAPENIDLGPLSGKPGAGTAAGAVFQTTQRFRITNIVLGGAVSGDNIRLLVGSRPYNFFASPAVVSIPFEISIDRGIDINVSDVTTPANVAWTFMLFGYPE